MGKDRRERRATERETTVAVDNTSRKTWNKDDYAAQAEKREKKVRGQVKYFC